jgi:hypothetical protein
MSSANNSNSIFQDFPINVKLIISSLWVAVMFCYVYSDYIEVYIPSVLAEAMEVAPDKEGDSIRILCSCSNNVYPQCNDISYSSIKTEY